MASQHLSDGLTSAVSGLGTDRDKSATVTYTLPNRDDAQAVAAYTGAWLPRKIIDQPAEDATRKWRAWQGDPDQISALEAAEKALGLQDKLDRAKRLAGIFGRAHIYIGTADSDLTQPLNPERMRRGGIRFLNVLDSRYIGIGEIQSDTMAPNFGEPKFYSGSNGAQVHPSRFVTLYGAERPDGWVYGREGDSVLLAMLDAIKRHDGTVANIAALLYEARLDVITIPGLSALVSDPAEEEAFVKRIQAMRAMAGNFGTVLLNGSTTPGDPSETWEQKNFSFATLPDIITKAQEEVSAAARIPRAILFGTGAGGLGATGDLELSAYYDRINSIQTNEFEPAMSILDECLIRHALGKRPDELWYEWRPLWQMSDKEKAEIADKTTAAIDKFVTAISKAPEYMAESMINAVTEIGLLPGLEKSYGEWIEAGGPDSEQPEDMTPDAEDNNEDDNAN